MMTLRSGFGAAAALSLALSLPATVAAQITEQNDPANLAGERVSAPDLADTLPIDHGAPALEQLLRKLRTRASFMLIVAHPDDEDGGMLTYLSRGQGARVAMLTLTRGEGGQNLMSGDFEDALGLIRTQELLAADRYLGVDQLFGTEVDFGFSKTKEEAFSKWTHDRVLYDAVRAVRLYRPLVIGSVFIGAATDGHGQHQVSGEIAQEVFKAAGDPTVFPDQIAQGLQPWQPLKVYARIPFARIDAQGMFDYATNQYAQPRFENYVTGAVTTTVPKANVLVAEGTPDPLLGGPNHEAMSYVQFARQGLSLQKSQIGPGVRTAPAGRADVSYHRYGSHILTPDGKPQPNDGSDDSALESSFFSGIDTSLPGIATLAPAAPPSLKTNLQAIDNKIAEAQKQFDPAHPSAITEPLRLALQTLDTVISGTEGSTLPLDQKTSLLHELRIKRVQLDNALVLALGITLDASAAAQPLTTAPSATFTIAVHNNGQASLPKPSLRVTANAAGAEAQSNTRDSGEARLLKPGESQTETIQLPFRKEPTPTRPYFSRTNVEQPYYDVANPALRNAPATPPALVASAQINLDGVSLTIPAVVGNGDQPTSFVPPASLSLDRNTTVLTPGQSELALTLSVRPPNTPLASASTGAPASWKQIPPAAQTSSAADKEFRYSIPNEGRAPLSLHASVTTKDGHSYSEGYRPVGYGDLPRTNFYTAATLRVVPVDVTTAPGLNIAYLPGTGDDVPAALTELGVTPHLITTADLTPDKLKPYDAVVLGVRAYEAHRELLAANDALNAYAAAGGVVIAQYNTRIPAGVGPYPLTLDHTENVVEEDAPVTILNPAAPILAWPNRITAADFSGWIEERGHGFISSWDPHYEALLETHDHGQQPQRGGLLVARTGKGAWVYIALALYRQLPEGVPGSYRLLANLISAGKNPQFASH